jgi:hypothetical protein
MSPKLLTVPTLVLLTALLAACSPAAVEAPEAEAASPTPEIVQTPEPTTPAGSRDLPWLPGTSAQFGSSSVWTFVVGDTSLDQWPAIAAANEFSTPPAEGNMFITAPVKLEVADNEQTASGADPWGSFSITYVTAAGTTAGECMGSLPAPGDLYDVGTMYGGASVEFLACAEVAADQVAGGTWAVRSLIDGALVIFYRGTE